MIKTKYRWVFQKYDVVIRNFPLIPHKSMKLNTSDQEVIENFVIYEKFLMCLFSESLSLVQ